MNKKLEYQVGNNKKFRVVPVQVMMANTGSRGTAPPILNLGTSSKLSPTRPGRFTPGKSSDTNWIRDTLDPRAGLELLEKRNIF